MSPVEDTVRPTGTSSLLSFIGQASVRWFPQVRWQRLILALLLFAAAVMPGVLGEVTRASLVDAYVQVAVFVAATLLIFYVAEKAFRFDMTEVFRRAKVLQVPVAAGMGAIPGCGGAVMVVAAYASGNVSMGAVVATLTATMGDAAFLLIATRPDAAAVLLPVALVTGVFSGYIVDAFCGQARFASGKVAEVPRIGCVRKRDIAYGLVALPGLVIGVISLMQVEFTAGFDVAVTTLALLGTALGFAIWAVTPVCRMTNPADPPLTRMAEETSFIAVWVIAAFLAYEYLHAFAGLDLAAMFKTAGPLLPLVAIVIGFIPGCGPQVLVTTLYINGLIPFAALLGNAISNDGDALFPAIALHPRAAVLATLYSAIPAVIVAYGFLYFLPEVL